MTDRSCYELQTFSTLPDLPEKHSQERAQVQLQWQESRHETPEILTIPGDGRPVCVGIDQQTGELTKTDEFRTGVEFRVVNRRLGTALGMIARTPDILVNGLPALGLTVLSPKDALVLAPGRHTYVTERVRPYVGKPTDDLLGKRCPFCRIPIAEETRVVTHRCGVAYHNETAESHPDVPAEDRLNCFEKVRACLSCGRAVTLDEELVWDPATL